MSDNTQTSETRAPRQPARGLDHVTLALGGCGLVTFWCLLALWWIES